MKIALATEELFALEYEKVLEKRKAAKVGVTAGDIEV